MQNHSGPPSAGSPLRGVEPDLHLPPPRARLSADGNTALVFVCPQAGSLELLMPPTAPTRFGGADGPSFGEFPGDKDVAVALYVAEPSVAQGVGRYSGGQIQGAPQLHHLCRRTEAGRARPPARAPLPQPGRHRAAHPGRTALSRRAGPVRRGADTRRARPTLRSPLRGNSGSSLARPAPCFLAGRRL